MLIKGWHGFYLWNCINISFIKLCWHEYKWSSEISQSTKSMDVLECLIPCDYVIKADFKLKIVMSVTLLKMRMVVLMLSATTIWWPLRLPLDLLPPEWLVGECVWPGSVMWPRAHTKHANASTTEALVCCKCYRSCSVCSRQTLLPFVKFLSKFKYIIHFSNLFDLALKFAFIMSLDKTATR